MKLLKKQVVGNIIRNVYNCPCGSGVIQEEQEYTPGHRDCMAFCRVKGVNTFITLISKIVKLNGNLKK